MTNEWMLLLEMPLLLALIALVTQSGFFIPLPISTVRKILKSAEIKRSDILYDLGSGDGRIIIAAAKEYGIKAVGIENNPLLYLISKWNVTRHNVSSKVKLIRSDLFRQNLSEANIVVVYLTQRLNDKLKPKLEKELKKGVRIVSADHVFKGWKEVSKIKTGHFNSHLYKI